MRPSSLNLVPMKATFEFSFSCSAAEFENVSIGQARASTTRGTVDAMTCLMKTWVVGLLSTMQGLVAGPCQVTVENPTLVQSDAL